MQHLVELRRINAPYRFPRVDDALAHKIASDFQSGLGRAFAVSGLQDPEPVLLNRELHILHVAIMGFKRITDRDKFLEDFRLRFFHGGKVAAAFLALGDGQRLRCSNTGDHILALGIYQELAIETVGAGRGVAGETDTGRAIIAHIAEHHALHRNGSTPGFGNVMQTPIGMRTLVHPGAENGADGTPELFLWIAGEIAAQNFSHASLVFGDDFLPVVS